MTRIGINGGIGLRHGPRLAGGGFAGAYDAIPSIAAAYGMRRLRSAYTGSLLRLRRDSDNAESNFGYTAAGDLDTAAIATWLGAASGYVTTWYDQSGNGYNAVQTTAAVQPLYVASGQNGKPVLQWDASNDRLQITISLTASNYTFLLSYKFISWDGFGSNHIFDSQLGRLAVGQQVGGYGWFDGGWRITGAVTGDFRLITYLLSTTSAAIYINGSAQGSITYTETATDGVTVIGDNATNPGSNHFNGDIAEFIISSAAWPDADRQAAEAAANAYWAVYA